MVQKEVPRQHGLLHRPVLWLVVLALAGLGLGLGVALPSSHGSPSAIKVAHLLTATSAANACGSWATDPTDPTETSITQATGLILSCDLVGNTWVIVTEGTTNPPSSAATNPPTQGVTYSVIGAILTYSCNSTDTNCLDPSTPHLFASWTVTRYPGPEYFKPTDLATATVILGLTLGDNATGPLMFNIVSNTWFTTESSTLFTCETEWGNYKAEPTPTVPMEQGFLAVYPQCSSVSG